MRRRVVVTGLGCVSPVGNDVPSSWDSLLAGRSGVGPITRFDATNHKVRICAEVKDFDAAALLGSREARRMDRFTQFAVVAAIQAMNEAGLTVNDHNRDRIGAVVGSGIGGVGTIYEQMLVLLQRGPERVSPFLVPMMLPDTAAAMIAIQFGLQGPNMAVVSACASGTNAVGEATEMIRRDKADVILAGGSESSILPIAIAGMTVMNALSTRNDDPTHASRPFDRDRDGFVMGEGGAILVLEEYEHAKSRGANILAEVIGYGSNCDAFHVSAPSESGKGAAACMQLALDDAGIGVKEIDYINAHGTGTRLNDKNETEAIKSVFGERAYRVPISSTKSMTGHLLGGAGALEAIICVKALQDGLIPPTMNYENLDPDCDLDYVPNKYRAAKLRKVMSNSFGFGGHNATIIFSRVEADVR